MSKAIIVQCIDGIFRSLKPRSNMKLLLHLVPFFFFFFLGFQVCTLSMKIKMTRWQFRASLEELQPQVNSFRPGFFIRGSYHIVYVVPQFPGTVGRHGNEKAARWGGGDTH